MTLTLTTEAFAGRQQQQQLLPNCSHSQNGGFTSAQVIFRCYLMPATYFFGICGNMINILVFANKQMRCQLVNWFLCMLAISDLCVLLCSFFVFSLPVIAEYFEDEQLVAISPRLLVDIYPFMHISHTTSVYLTILVSVHRYLGVCHPFLIRRISSKHVVRGVIGSAILFAGIFNLPRRFEIEAIDCLSEKFGHRSSMVAPTSLFENSTYTIVYRNVLFTIVMFFLPFATLTWVNCKIVSTLKSSSRIRRRMTVSRKKGNAPSATAGQTTPAAPTAAELVVLHQGGKGAGITADNHSVTTTTTTVATTPQAVHTYRHSPPSTHPLPARYQGSHPPVKKAGSIQSGGSTTPPHVPSSAPRDSVGNASLTKISLLSRKLSKHYIQERKEHGVTVMLVAMVTGFLLFNMLAFFNNIVELAGEQLGSYTILIELSALLVNVNGATTIIIYLTFGSKYRAFFCQVCCRRPVPGGPYYMYSNKGILRAMPMATHSLTTLAIKPSLGVAAKIS